MTLLSRLMLLLIPALLWLTMLGTPTWADPVPDAKIVINVPSRTLVLLSGDTTVKTYPVGVGRMDFPTPEGQYEVTRKVFNPAWEDPFHAHRSGIWAQRGRHATGPASPLGTRWIGFHDSPKGEYGIHGTPDVNSVGKFSSHGCIRMQIHDAEELYEKVAMGTPVIVNYDPIFTTRTGTDIKVTISPNWFRKGFKGGLSAGVLKHDLQSKYPDIDIDENLLAQVLQKATGHSQTDGPPAQDANFKIRINNSMPILEE